MLKEFEPYFMKGGDMSSDFLSGPVIPELKAIQAKAEKAAPNKPKGYDVGYKVLICYVLNFLKIKIAISPAKC